MSRRTIAFELRVFLKLAEMRPLACDSSYSQLNYFPFELVCFSNNSN